MIKTNRFLLSPLSKTNVSEKYLSWLTQDLNSYIDYTKTNPTYEDLEKYVGERENRNDVLFLGIFTKDLKHIGNIKYEPIDMSKKTAVMGILIGEIDWRGQGVAAEVIKASGKYLAKKYKIRNILLGVDASNKFALSAYKKIGFRIQSQDESSIKMIWTI
jgi:[ribosomal protein S5]-alanine N-acetyltransferase